MKAGPNEDTKIKFIATFRFAYRFFRKFVAFVISFPLSFAFFFSLSAMVSGCRSRSTPAAYGDASLTDASVTDASGTDASDALPILYDGCCEPEDIFDLLSSIPTMTVEESYTTIGGYRYFLLSMEQPVDHEDPESATFRQYMTLLHRSKDAPMVLLTAGYWNYWQDYRIEPTRLFETNQLVVEHRYFGDSVPVQPEWEFLNIRQAAADLHRVVDAVRPLYGGRWISAGASKDGMTAVYFRRFYPDDVDGTLAYVAPISFAAPDVRYIPFLENVGDVACRDSLRDLQIEGLTRREQMMDRLSFLAGEQGLEYTHVGGLEAAFELTVVSLPFTFWQYYGVDYCSFVPTTDSDDDEIFWFLNNYAGFDYSSDLFMEMFISYYYQAHTELGYPDVDISHLQDLLTTGAVNPEGGVLPPNLEEPVTFDPSVMLDIASWVETHGHRLMFIYGEYDPWTAGAFSLGDATESHFFTIDEGTHYASIMDLPVIEQQVAVETLRDWLGIPSTRESRQNHRFFMEKQFYPGHLFARDHVYQR